MAANANDLGVDSDRIAIYGPSAGGGLAVPFVPSARNLMNYLAGANSL